MKPIQSQYIEQVDPTFPKTYVIPNWYKIRDDKRLEVIREIIERYGRDPRISDLAVKILKDNQVEPRDYRGQAAAILHWVQHHIYYVNEPCERLQAPLATLRMGYGDCDDMVILLMSLFHSIHLPTKLVIAGKKGKKLVRHIEGNRLQRGIKWTHIYCTVGNNPFTPTQWYFCEPTMKVPLGWDAVDHLNKTGTLDNPLSELGSLDFGATSAVGITVGTALGAAKDEFSRILPAVFIGALTAVATEVLIEYVRATDLYVDWRAGIAKRHKARHKKRKKAK